MSSFLFWFFGLLTLLALLEAGLARSLGKRPLRRALLLSLLWLTFSAAYGGYLGKTRGLSAALDFGAMYGLEYLLSIDNLFAFYGTFRLFHIRGAAQGHLLTVGVLLAVLLRALLIWAGLSLLRTYEAVFPLLGILLFVAAVRLSRNPDSGSVIPGARLLGTLIPPSEEERSRGLLVRCGRTLRSPRLLALLSIEFADLLFALDSVPAAFAITLDPTVVFPANLCAVMGLRSLYPLVQHAADNLQWLNRAIPWVLALMGGELCLKPWFSVPTLNTAVLIASLFLGAFLASARRKS
ncbi:TerC family protein [Methylacidimicrobium tartarophylax]|uniref:Inner membrane protein alx n=1 Tax=Methylacidimicrobium tartarophylax TaxID=1041768 RepID=A0A5E6MEZ2_9BACT|nr:hypothetical protein [Methylacidimicrobium tartarophylax]VVM08057.1 Inner membrane protein alx [Methylacidimicrobium tartarophylax]